MEGLLTTRWILRGDGQCVAKDKGVAYTHRKLPISGDGAAAAAPPAAAAAAAGKKAAAAAAAAAAEAEAEKPVEAEDSPVAVGSAAAEEADA